ncbi:MAG: hypothetical protein ACYTXT_34695 [Nostoc sp.]
MNESNETSIKGQIEDYIYGRANASKLLLITTKIKNQRRNQDLSFDLLSKSSSCRGVIAPKQARRYRSKAIAHPNFDSNNSVS